MNTHMGVIQSLRGERGHTKSYLSLDCAVWEMVSARSPHPRLGGVVSMLHGLLLRL